MGSHTPAEDGQACYRRFLSLFVFLFNISPNESQSSICISSNSVNVGVPRYATGNVNPQVLSACDNFQDLTM